VLTTSPSDNDIVCELDVGAANMLVYTLWTEWAQCNVCGKANGERRRSGS